jgi:hypothetical protein
LSEAIGTFSFFVTLLFIGMMVVVAAVAPAFFFIGVDFAFLTPAPVLALLVFGACVDSAFLAVATRPRILGSPSLAGMDCIPVGSFTSSAGEPVTRAGVGDLLGRPRELEVALVVEGGAAGGGRGQGGPKN